MERDDCYDVIVAGAGPAGSMASYRLAQRGYRVLLLEKCRLPRDKVCAGGLTPKAYRQLDFAIDDLVLARATQARLQGAGCAPCIVRADDATVWMVRRAEFDHRLANQARAAGVDLHEAEPLRGAEFGSRVRVRTDCRQYAARVLVGADGAGSLVARLSGLHARWRHDVHALALEAEVEVAEDRLGNTVVVDLSVPGGYGWIFPKGRLYSIGAGTFSDRYFKTLRAQLECFIAANGVEARAPLAVRGRRVPIFGGRAPLHTKGVLLVGDAAGVADPFFGEGIAYALRSGQLAAQAIDDYLRGRQPGLDGYTRGIQRTIGRDLHLLGIIGGLVYRRPALSLRLFAASGLSQRLAALILSGRLSMGGGYTS